MSNHVLKGTLFGGFKRSDVIEYIERNAKENSEAVAVLKEELENLRKDRDSLSEERGSLLERSGRLDALKEEKDALMEEVVALRTANAALEQELEALRAEVEGMRPEIEEYHAIKERLCDIQIEACRRATELEETTKRRMDELEDSTYERLQGLVDGCRAAYDETFVKGYPKVFEDLNQLLARPQFSTEEEIEEVFEDAWAENV